MEMIVASDTKVPPPKSFSQLKRLFRDINSCFVTSAYKEEQYRHMDNSLLQSTINVINSEKMNYSTDSRNQVDKSCQNSKGTEAMSQSTISLRERGRCSQSFLRLPDATKTVSTSPMIVLFRDRRTPDRMRAPSTPNVIHARHYPSNRNFSVRRTYYAGEANHNDSSFLPKFIDSRKRRNRPKQVMSQYCYASDDEEERQCQPKDHNSPLQSPMNMRARLIQELVETQSLFTADMLQVIAAFDSISTNITPEDRYLVLSNLTEVIEVSRELDRCWCQKMLQFATKDCDQVNIAKATLPYKNSLYSAFSVYATNYNPCNFTKNTAIETFIQKGFQLLLNSNPNLLNVESMLIKPVQRVFKYQQLFEKLQEETKPSHEDYPATCELNEYFGLLLRKINETKRWNEILGDVFRENRRSRIMSGSKSLRSILRNLRPSRIAHTDPKLAQEKWKLENLREMSKTFQKWIARRLELIDLTLVAERSFLYAAQNLCTSSGNLRLHSQIKSSSLIGAVSVQDVNAHATIVDATRAYLLQNVKPKLEANVIKHLTTLNDILYDPELLVDELERTQEALSDITIQVKQAAARNQPTHLLEEEQERLQRTKDTILENLLTQLPLLTKAAEKILFSAVAYAMTLSENLMRHYTNMMQNQMVKAGIMNYNQDYYQNRSRVPATPVADVTCRALMDYADEVRDWIKAKKILRVASTSSKSSSHSSLLRYPDGVTTRQMEILKQNIRQTTRGYTSPLPDTLRLPNTSQRLTGISRAHSDLSGTSPAPYPASTRQIFSGASTPNEYHRRQSTPNIHPRSAAIPTHRASFSYEARDYHQVSVLAGQSVIMLQEHDGAGNREWCKVQVLPNETIGFVPTSYLKPI